MTIRMVIYTAGILVLAVPIACNRDPGSTAPPDGVPLEVHLQAGFADQFVRIELNGNETFEADLSPNIPFAGPIALFATVVPRGNTLLVVSRRPSNYSVFTDSDTSTVTLGSAEQYYLGLRMNGDSLVVDVRDSPYLYL